MKTIIKIILLGAILVGCGSKNKNLDKYVKYEQNLIYTKVEKLIKNNEVVLTLNITYLNSSNNKIYNDGYQNFLVTVYGDNNIKFEKDRLLVNNKKPMNIIKIDDNSTIYKNIAIKNNWSDYYLVRYYNTKKDIIKLNYFYDNDDIVKIEFKKE